MSVPNSLTMYNTSVLTESLSHMLSCNLQVIDAPSHCTPFILQCMMNADYPIISSAYGTNLERILNQILYVVFNSDIPL
jgi:hypothetical protein